MGYGPCGAIGLEILRGQRQRYASTSGIRYPEERIYNGRTLTLYLLRRDLSLFIDGTANILSSSQCALGRSEVQGLIHCEGLM